MVADSRAPRDGRFIERVGFYNPIATGADVRIPHRFRARPALARQRGADFSRSGQAAQGPGPWPVRAAETKPVPADDSVQECAASHDAFAERRVPIGKVSGVFGVHGWLRVRSATEPPARILDYQPWQVGGEGRWKSFEVHRGRPHGGGFVAKLNGLDDRETARRLVGADIAVRRSQLPDPGAGEYYWCDLVGLTVRDGTGTVLGRVRRLMATGANDVIVVTDGDAELLIPLSRAKSCRASTSNWKRSRSTGPPTLGRRVMDIAVVSIFPEMIAAVTDHGVAGRAFDTGLVSLHLVNPRDCTRDRTRRVDDRPYGGGAGMVMLFEPMRDAIRRARSELDGLAHVVYLSPQGGVSIRRESGHSPCGAG